jgi:hypothetical protein
MSVAIIFIGVGPYINFFDRFYNSIKNNFLPNTAKRFFVFSDSIPNITRSDVVDTRVPHRSPRDIKLSKFDFIQSKITDIQSHDYVFYFDADNVVNDIIDESEILRWFDCSKIVAVMHPWHHIRSAGRFERSLKSSAYLTNEETDKFPYHQSCFWGCAGDMIDTMSSEISSMISADRIINHKNENNICDEIYFNKFCCINKSLVKSLDTEYANPGEAYYNMTGYKFHSANKITHDNAAQSHTYKTVSSDYRIPIGAYYQLFKRSHATYVALNQFRLKYPLEPIIIFEDGGDNFSDLALKFNCSRNRDENNCKSWRNRDDSTDQFIFAQRIYNACVSELSSVDWIVILEPDVETFNNIKNIPKYSLSGPRGPTWTVELQEYIKARLGKSKINIHYTGCGGSIFNRGDFISAWESLTHEDRLMGPSLDPRIGKAEDATLSYIFQITGFETGILDEFAGYKTTDKHNFAFVHGDKKYYNINIPINFTSEELLSPTMKTTLFDNYNTDKDTIHSYGIFYDNILNPYKNASGILLELGVKFGGSCSAFKSALKNFTVMGVDLTDQVEMRYRDDFKLIKGNLFSTTILNELNNYSYDIIIDDMSHNISDIILAFNILSQRVKPGGCYIIEDIHNVELMVSLFKTYALNLDMFNIEYIDRRSVKNTRDDYIIHLTKKQ